MVIVIGSFLQIFVGEIIWRIDFYIADFAYNVQFYLLLSTMADRRKLQGRKMLRVLGILGTLDDLDYFTILSLHWRCYSTNYVIDVT
jgi:hypothetical protein